MFDLCLTSVQDGLGMRYLEATVSGLYITVTVRAIPRAQRATASPNWTLMSAPFSISCMRGCSGAPELEVCLE